MNNKIICYSCQEDKYKISATKSKLMPNTFLMLCSNCYAKDFEPRWAIVISGRQYGSEKVKDYVINKKYIGEEIVASELLI